MEYTKFEKARMIGARALQLSMGAPFMVELSQKDLEKIKYDVVKIACLEFDKGVLPITVKRPFPKIHQEEKMDLGLKGLEQDTEEKVE